MESFGLHSLSTSYFSLSSRASLFRRSKPVIKSPPFLHHNLKPSPSLPTLRSPSLLASKPFISSSHSSKPRKTHFPIQASKSAEPGTTLTPPPPLQGAKPIPFIISIAVGIAVRFFVPKPVEVTPQAWQLLAIFLSTIAGLVLSPLPVGAWAFLGLTASIVTGTLSFQTAFLHTHPFPSFSLPYLLCTHLPHTPTHLPAPIPPYDAGLAAAQMGWCYRRSAT